MAVVPWVISASCRALESPQSTSAAVYSSPPPPSTVAAASDPPRDTYGVVSLEMIHRDIAKVTSKYRDADRILNGAELVPTVLLKLTNVTDDLNALDNMARTSQPLTDFGRDVLYYGPMAFGSTGQVLNVSVDTGSADLWVQVNCRKCSGAQYNTAKSKTYRQTGQSFSIQYGQGQASGSLVQDTVSINGLSVKNQYFGAVDKVSDDFNGTPESGLVGMAFSTIATSHKPTWFESLMQQNELVAPLFSVFLTRRQPTGSEVCIGCYDTRKVQGGVTWLPVVRMGYWTVAMGGAVVNGVSLSSGSIYAAIDTGTTLVYVHDTFAKSLYGQIPSARFNGTSGYWTMPCAKISSTTVSLLFGSTPFTINMVDFNLGRVNAASSDCACGILSLSDTFPKNLAIIGDLFLKSWYSSYDYSHGGRVGLSRSII